MSLINRRDHRSLTRFLINIKYHTEKEVEYLINFLNRHNQNRHKRSMVIIPWGASTSGIVFDNNIEQVGRPDFLLAVCKDNSYITQEIVPIEVQHQKSPEQGKYYIKKEKIERKFDSITNKITSIKQNILCVLGFEGTEQYFRLTPKSKLYKDMIFRGCEYPHYSNGGKYSYYLYINQIKWKEYKVKEPQLSFKEII